MAIGARRLMDTRRSRHHRPHKRSHHRHKHRHGKTQHKHASQNHRRRKHPNLHREIRNNLHKYEQYMGSLDRVSKEHDEDDTELTRENMKHHHRKHHGRRRHKHKRHHGRKHKNLRREVDEAKMSKADSEYEEEAAAELALDQTKGHSIVAPEDESEETPPPKPMRNKFIHPPFTPPLQKDFDGYNEALPGQRKPDMQRTPKRNNFMHQPLDRPADHPKDSDDDNDKAVEQRKPPNRYNFMNQPLGRQPGNDGDHEKDSDGDNEKPPGHRKPPNRYNFMNQPLGRQPGNDRDREKASDGDNENSPKERKPNRYFTNQPKRPRDGKSDVDNEKPPNRYKFNNKPKRRPPGGKDSDKEDLRPNSFRNPPMGRPPMRRPPNLEKDNSAIEKFGNPGPRMDYPEFASKGGPKQDINVPLEEEDSSEDDGIDSSASTFTVNSNDARKMGPQPTRKKPCKYGVTTSNKSGKDSTQKKSSFSLKHIKKGLLRKIYEMSKQGKQGLKKLRKNLTAPSSRSDEEHVIKSNIYKALGYMKGLTILPTSEKYTLTMDPRKYFK
ncbi:uncharacterized protein LOC126379691 [Pectinophora gossypiella]|uniref:uncharacterized protein LOC126379691 n=1 Tax=Pectinophora gossypiella TaxID=13191 RepID=UPI00214E2171|nr:uncharacterized protein LOC126379691 [Pectinophora gossypiella]